MSGRQDYEKLGSFYLGRTIDSPEGDPGDEQVLYDARDLTTHAVIVGMTGSGKTGLGIALLEEAAIDGIPSIAIDVKGDLTNLFLSFPQLRAGDFRPWIDEGAAARSGVTPEALAESTAESWRKGLDQWDQAPDRIERLKAAVDFTLFTPGSNSGTPISLLGTLDAPGAALRDDSDAMRDRVAGTVSGLLTLVGIDPDPVRSREHILLSGILDAAWRAGRSLALADLIRSVQAPPFSSVGVVDLESFFPAGDRAVLAMLLNNLLASPGFQVWREGEPLDIDRLLSTPDGRPRLSVLYIAHLSDAERMFFVTRLLHEVVAWMRTQSGTGSLRALLYMDEVFGYFPPSANPPSKTPLLTLMKQARAFGLGVVLATQNPVDLDYKGLSNAGTWMLGRLQTERDKARVLDGLEGASSGAGFDRQEMDRVLSALGKRRFVLHSVHEDGPVLFHTRWVMSYLAGPLSVAQVRTLSASLGRETRDQADGVGTRPGPDAARIAGSAPAGEGSVTAGVSASGVPAVGHRPLLPHGVPEVFIDLGRHVADPSRLRYRPCLLASARVRYVKADLKLDVWQETSVLTGLGAHPDWGSGEPFSGETEAISPMEGASFDALPGEGARPASYREWQDTFRDWLYRDRPYGLWSCAALDAVSEPGESEASFRMRLRLAARERRDAEVDALRSRYATKLQTIQRRFSAAEDRLTKEEGQYGQQKLSAALGVGTSILGALFGGRGRTSFSGASQAARGLGRAAQERTDVRLAQEKVEAARTEMAAMEQELAADVAALAARYEPESLVIEAVRIPARKSDIEVIRLVLAWTPWLDGATPERAWLPTG